MQSPIVLDTSWLVIGHVDEFVQFLPADTPRGWRVATADVEAGLNALRDAQARVHVGTKASSVSGRFAQKATLDDLLADAAFLEANALAASKFAENLAILKRETGLTDAEVIGVPTLLETSSFGTVGQTVPQRSTGIRPPAPERIIYGPCTLIASYPAAINGLLLDRRPYIAPRPWGPVIEGRDLLQDAVDAAYARAGLTVRYVDDWLSHHLQGGEVHCGTNTTRLVRAAWWQ